MQGGKSSSPWPPAFGHENGPKSTGPKSQPQRGLPPRPTYSTTLRGGCLIPRPRRYCSDNMDLIPALSGRHLDADAAKQLLVLQHEKIRVLLDKARGVAERALGGKKRAAARSPDAISRIRRTVEVHLQFEERALAEDAARQARLDLLLATGAFP